MSYEHVRRYIEERQRSARSIEDQVEISHAMWDEEVVPSDDGLKANEVEDELVLDLDYQVRTSLGHLVDLDLVEEFSPPGPDTLVIAEWLDGGDGEVILGEVEETAEEGLEALANAVSSEDSDGGVETVADGSGVTLRSVVASKFNVVPEKVENFLRTTERPVDVLNEAVDEIEETDGVETTEDFGEIVFINMPYRYRLTEKAVALYEK